MLPVSGPMPRRASVPAEDLKLILSALSAYSHNSTYQPVIDRLQSQAVELGVAKLPKKA